MHLAGTAGIISPRETFACEPCPNRVAQRLARIRPARHTASGPCHNALSAALCTAYLTACWLFLQPPALQAASSSSSSDYEWSLKAQFFSLGDGDAIRMPSGRPEAGPCSDYSREQAIQMQLQALRDNDKPYFDHGIEVLYRFANIDPFQRSK